MSNDHEQASPSDELIPKNKVACKVVDSNSQGKHQLSEKEIASFLHRPELTYPPNDASGIVMAKAMTTLTNGCPKHLLFIIKFGYYKKT